MLDLGFRKKYWDRYSELDLDSEAFQYAPVKNLQLPEKAKQSSISITPSQNEYKIVFVDGYLSLGQSHLPEQLVCLPMDEAMLSYAVFIQNQMTRMIKEEMDPFAALNGACQGQGAFVYLPPKIELSTPVHIEHYFTGPDMASPRLLFSLGKHSRLELIQHWHLSENFVNGHIDAVLDAGAHLQLKNIQQKASKATLFHSLRAHVKKDAQITFRLYSEGSAMTRHSIKVQLLEENASALLQGLTFLEENAQSHIHATVEHLAPHTQSRQHFKALLKGRTKSSFEGKIYVHPIAQKTQGYQLSNNLLLSDEATINVKPNLEIFADDVKASHGATITQMDAESIFYLTSRGIPKQEAQQYLIKSFIQELSGCLP